MIKLNVPLIVGIIIVVVLFSALLLLPAGSNDQKTNTTERIVKPLFYIMSVSTDKMDYEEEETVKITATITAPKDLNGAQVKFVGVENNYGSYKVKEIIDVNLSEGENIIETESELPSCSSCSGVEEGNHSIYAILMYNDSEIINASARIVLEG
jgi:hypothetical protein